MIIYSGVNNPESTSKGFLFHKLAKKKTCLEQIHAVFGLIIEQQTILYLIVEI